MVQFTYQLAESKCVCMWSDIILDVSGVVVLWIDGELISAIWVGIIQPVEDLNKANIELSLEFS